MKRWKVEASPLNLAGWLERSLLRVVSLGEDVWCNLVGKVIQEISSSPEDIFQQHPAASIS